MQPAMVSSIIASFLPKSKKTWAFLGTSSSILAYLAYDRAQVSAAFEDTAEKCKLIGQEPALDDSLPSLNIVAAGRTEEEVQAKLRLFRRYCAKWLTMAGVDYRLTVVSLEEQNVQEKETAVSEELASRVLSSVNVKGDDLYSLDSFTHSILLQKHPDRLYNLGCDQNAGFAERCLRFFNQRQFVKTLSLNVMRIWQKQPTK